MAKLSKYVFTLSDKKELVLSQHDALELYHELFNIFGGKLTTKSVASVESTGASSSVKELTKQYNPNAFYYGVDTPAVTFTLDSNSTDATTSGLYNCNISPSLHSITGSDRIFGSTLNDTITLSDNDSWIGTTHAFGGFNTKSVLPDQFKINAK